MTAADPLLDVPVHDLTLDGRRTVTIRSWPSVAAKVAFLARLAVADAQRPDVRELARVLGSPGEVHAWVRDRIAYENEALESLETAPYTLARRLGDCDAQAELVAALVVALGGSARLLPVGGVPDDPAHLVAVVRDGGGLAEAGAWQPLDAPAPPGWTWAETTVRATWGESPAAAVARLGALRRDLG